MPEVSNTVTSYRALFWPIAQTALQIKQCYPILPNEARKVWGGEMTYSRDWQGRNQPFSWAVSPLPSLLDPTAPAVLLMAPQRLGSSCKAVKHVKWMKANVPTSLMTVEATDELQTLSVRSRGRQAFGTHSCCHGICVTCCSELNSLHNVLLWILLTTHPHTLEKLYIDSLWRA